MANPDPARFAVASVAKGISAREGLRQFRAQGGSIRDSTWFQIVSQARVNYALQITEVTLPLNRRPTATEIGVLPSRVAKGWVQYVDTFVRDKETGIVGIRHYAVRGTQLLTRATVIKRALGAMTTATNPFGSFPDETVLGAVYTATYQLSPRAAE